MTANENTDRFYLLKKVPAVLRARGFRLYTQDGRRLVDLWLNGGAAVLGHTPPNMLRELKNTASRGLYAPFPHFTEGRYLKALSKLFPGCSFRLYAAPVNIGSKKSSHGGTETRRHGGGEEGGEGVRLWRPFNNSEEPFVVEEGVSLFVPVLPGVQSWRPLKAQQRCVDEKNPYGVALNKGNRDEQGARALARAARPAALPSELPVGLFVLAAKSEDLLKRFPPNDILSPVLLAVAARGVYDLLASPQRGKPQLPRVFKALKDSRWQRRGIYLYLKKEPADEEWAALFGKFLEAGFLLPPVPSMPVILPGELSAGEDMKLAAVLS